MGCADVVPGVSGGTVALILGIYQRLVTAISHFDLRLLALVRARQWRKAVEHVDLRFLVTLAAGIVVGIVGMSLLMHRLLHEDFSRSLTFAVFFGMILASASLVARMIEVTSPSHVVMCLILGGVAATLAFWLTTLTATHGAAPSYPYIFLCGCVAICAMILPGISGAMILLVLGVYAHLTEVPKNLIHGEHIGASLATLVVFGSGCVISLICFSKILRWLLARHHTATMAVLCGFMFGALPKLWPFQHDTTPEVEKFKEKVFELTMPEPSAKTLVIITAAVLAAGFVFVVDGIVRRRAQEKRST